MDLKMEVYTPYLELVGILEVYRSVIWEEKAFGSGSFSVDALITPESNALLVPDNIIWIEGETAGVIGYIQEQSGKDGPYITVKGPELTGILEQRILWGQYDMTGTPPAIMHQLVNDCCISPTRGNPAESRVIPGLVSLTPAAGGDSIRVQKTGGTLLEALEQLGAAFGVAFGVRFNPAIPRMEFWTRWGQNRSINQDTNDPVFYSTELDDVLSSEYSYNAQDWRNVALVAGEGEGGDRVTVTVEADVPPAPVPPQPEKYTIALSVDPQGGGVASGGGQVNEGQNVTVTASPSSGYTFSGWKENGSIVSGNASYTFAATADRNLTAVFVVAVPVYTISASIDPAGSGTITGSGQYQEGATVTLTATVNDGYTFNGWKENGTVVSTDNPYSFTATANKAFVAAFSEKPASRLPDGYTELEYIHTPYKCGFDTGVKVNMATTGLIIDLEADTYGSGNELIFYTRSSTSPYFRLWRSSNTNVTRSFGSSGSNASTAVSMSNIRLQVSYLNGTLKVGEKQITKVSLTSTTANNVYLFSYAESSNGIKAKLYGAKMYDNGTLIRDWVPCINPNGTVGLYDLTEEKFYGNALSGTITPGPGV